MAMHFIVGMPRSGTTFLGRCLASHPEIAVFGESDFWGRSYVAVDAQSRYTASAIHRVAKIQQHKDWTMTTGDELGPLPGLPEGVYGRLVSAEFCRLHPPAHEREVYDAIVDVIRHYIGKPVVVEKCPGYIVFIERFAHYYPQARFIAVERDPFHFAASIRHERDRFHSPVTAAVIRFSRHPLIAILMWRSYALALARARRLLGDRLMVVGFDALTKQTEQTLVRIQRHLNVSEVSLDVPPSSVNRSGQSTTEPCWALAFWARVILGRTPALPGWNNAKVSILGLVKIVWSICSLPLAGLAFAVLNVHRASSPIRYACSFLMPSVRES